METIMPHCVVVDLDGTLIDTKRLLPLAKPEIHDYSAFHAAAVYAPAIEWTLRVVRDWHAIGVPVVISTARSAQYRRLTEEWLRMWFPHYTALHMRYPNDVREDHISKEDLLWDIMSSYKVLRAYDDNPDVIDMYRRNGVRTVTVRSKRRV